MNENLSEVLKRWRAIGNTLIENNPPGSEGEVNGRRFLACATEIEHARKYHPYTAGLTALVLAGSVIAGELRVENQERQREIDSAVYSSLAAPLREIPVIPTEHIPGQELGQDNWSVVASANASGSPNVASRSFTLSAESILDDKA